MDWLGFLVCVGMCLYCLICGGFMMACSVAWSGRVSGDAVVGFIIFCAGMALGWTAYVHAPFELVTK